MKSKKRVIALAVSMALLLICFVGATFAYFTDTEFEKDNIITVGNIEIDLYEHSEAYPSDPGEDTLKNNDEAYQDYLDDMDYLLPGQEVGKYTYIDNTGTNDAYVRFVVTVPGEMDAFLEYTWNAAYTVERVAGAQPTDPVVYYVTRNDELPAGQLSEPGLEKVGLNVKLTEADVAAFQQVFAAGTRDFDITVAAHAIQTEGFADAATAFAFFDAEENANVVKNEKVDA